MNSTMNLGLDTNCKINNLGKKVEEIVSKLTVLDTLGEKLNKFESTTSKVLANVERVTKRVQDVEKSVEFIKSQFETNKSDVTSLKTDISLMKSQNDHVHESIYVSAPKRSRPHL